MAPLGRATSLCGDGAALVGDAPGGMDGSRAGGSGVHVAAGPAAKAFGLHGAQPRSSWTQPLPRGRLMAADRP